LAIVGLLINGGMVMSEWISVEDRLPEDHILVLVCWSHIDGGGEYDMDYMDEEMWGGWFNRAEHYNIAGGNANEEAPYTHWMPLPEPPEAS
jgi:hypothetical protein